VSSRFDSKQLASLCRDPRRFVEQAADHEDRALALLAAEDIDMASQSSARLLITASTQQAVETLARRIHASGPRAQSPFVMTSGGELRGGAQALRDGYGRLLDAAATGSVLISAVEEIPAAGQEAFFDLLAGLESAPGPSAEVRLISGTTVSLLDRVATGAFSEQLFYRLNVIHVMAGASPSEVTLT
jgi:two-component system response regulator PilR (NtrC family)